VSTRWPGWRTLPGIEIAPLAEKARAQGTPCKHFSYVWDTPGQNYVSSCGWQVDGDGTVTLLGEGWEPVIEDGMLTGFRGIKGSTVEELVQVTAVVVPEGEPPWSPALTVRLPVEQIGMFRRGDAMADGIDIDTEASAASITVGFYSDDGSFTTVVWGITQESAASVIALIRERHGEPLAEFTAGADSAEALREEATAAMSAHAVFTCTHEGTVTP
jgi:hypothetical protein